MSDYTGRNAFLELGSTSIKFYIVSSSGETAGTVEHETKTPWDLGYDVFEHGRISPRTISHCLATLSALQAEFPEIPFESVTAVGTSALREAQNADVFQRLLREKLRIKIHIIEGGIEAFLLETGFRDAVESYPTGLFDLGGGSLELIEYLSAASTRKTSIPVGAIRLHCQLRRTRDLFEYIREGRRIAEETLRRHVIGPLPVYPELIGTGGTVRALVECLGRDEYRLDDVRGLVQREVNGPIWSKLAPHRRKLILPGLLVIESLFATFGTQRIVYRTASVKRGLISFTRMLPSL
jgi:exopolyphosphatase/guanosine-5'-triphosphate,3'-diphosphate pyrophosphatase